MKAKLLALAIAELHPKPYDLGFWVVRPQYDPNAKIQFTYPISTGKPHESSSPRGKTEKKDLTY